MFLFTSRIDLMLRSESLINDGKLIMLLSTPSQSALLMANGLSKSPMHNS